MGRGDEYFEKETLTYQGPAKLVLIRFKSGDADEILSEMTEFQDRLFFGTDIFFKGHPTTCDKFMYLFVLV